MYRYRGVITALFFASLLVLPLASSKAVSSETASSEAAVCIGAVFFIAAFCLRVWARMYIGEHSRGSKLACPTIIKMGPYKYANHPLYISNFMAGTSFALFHTGISLETAGFCAVYGTFLELLAINENKFLKSINPSTHQPHLIPNPHISIIASIIKDRYTWLWQAIMLGLICILHFRFPYGLPLEI